VSVVSDSIGLEKKVGNEMKLEEMVSLIRREWSDSMSDNGAIWRKTNDKLKVAKAEYPELYLEALELAYNG
jgi:hypothetical protein